MKLVSAPLNRQLRRLSNQPNLLLNKEVKVVTNIQNDLLAESIQYPKVTLNPIQKCIYCLKLLLDLHYKDQSATGSFRAFYPATYFFAGKLLAPHAGVIEKILIWAFSSREYDLMVSPYKEVQICTFDFPSELFLYSSSIRLQKRLIFGIDGWDNYSIKWVPSLCNTYESWGEFTTVELLRRVPNALIEYVEPHFRSYDTVPNPDLVVVYEGTKNEVPKHIQIHVIQEAVTFCKKTKKRLLFKRLHDGESVFSESEVLELGGIPFATSQNFTDHGKYFYKKNDDLESLIPSCALLIVFNSSHGNLEFGLNGIPSLNVITLPNYENASVVRALSRCGIVFVNGLGGLGMLPLLGHAIKSKVNVEYFIGKK